MGQVHIDLLLRSFILSKEERLEEGSNTFEIIRISVLLEIVLNQYASFNLPLQDIDLVEEEDHGGLPYKGVVANRFKQQYGVHHSINGWVFDKGLVEGRDCCHENDGVAVIKVGTIFFTRKSILEMCGYSVGSYKFCQAFNKILTPNIFAVHAGHQHHKF